jgi:hypothetical protein
MLFTAWSRANRLEEQAVSRAKLGPANINENNNCYSPESIKMVRGKYVIVHML